MPEPEIELNRFAQIDADMAYLDAQKEGATTAACVEAAIKAYLRSPHNLTEQA